MIFNLTVEAFRNALIAGLLTAIAAGIIGVFIVTRRMVSISGSIAHASLSGVGMGLITGISPVIGALILTPLAALGMGTVVKRTKLPEDTAIGMLWATGMAIGVILAALAGSTSDLSIYLFGDILSVPDADLILMGILDLLVIVLVLRFYNELLSVSFDEEFSRIVGISTSFLYFLVLALISLTVVTLLRVAGIILVIALLAIPAAFARRLTYNLPKMMLFAFILSMLFIFSGLFVSLQFKLPSGAVIALLCGFTFIILLSLYRFRNNRNGSKISGEEKSHS